LLLIIDLKKLPSSVFSYESTSAIPLAQSHAVEELKAGV
jgi:hypothetical protein